MKKAVCISCTHHYNERLLFIEQTLRTAGYDCTYITSDFHHVSKKPHRVELPHCIQLPTLPYTKNISVARLHSHMLFAKDAMKIVKQLKPDLLYVEIPPNSLSREAARYKKAFPETKLIFDIFDMWPESFPNNRAKLLLKLPFSVWGWFRNTGLPKADLVLTECELFRKKLQHYLKDTVAKTLYLCRAAATTEEAKAVTDREKLHLCYLGSINNIIDIPAISALIGHIQKLRPVALHIIGDGESREEFISSVQAVGAEVIFHGKIYDDAEKQVIFDQCHFGLNIMKESVFIGLTMKSVDYFAGALPIINSIQGDTWELVEREQIGVNIVREDPEKSARDILACDDLQPTLRSNTLRIFHKLFSFETFSEQLLNALEQTDSGK